MRTAKEYAGPTWSDRYLGIGSLSSPHRSADRRCGGNQAGGEQQCKPPGGMPARKQCKMRANMLSEKNPPRACRHMTTLGRFLSRISILVELGQGEGGEREGGEGDPQLGTRPGIVGPPHLTKKPGHGRRGPWPCPSRPSLKARPSDPPAPEDPSGETGGENQRGHGASRMPVKPEEDCTRAPRSQRSHAPAPDPTQPPPTHPTTHPHKRPPTTRPPTGRKDPARP